MLSENKIAKYHSVVMPKDYPKKSRREIVKIKQDIAKDPLQRFEYIRQMAIERNFQTTYVIELKSTIINSNFTRSYPSKGFAETPKHTKNSRCFYVGTTWHTAEMRFHTAKNNHMWNKSGEPKAGAVRKHRLIEDAPPFSESLSSLQKLTERYGYESSGKDGRIKSDLFEHYVGWALYKCGFRTWGPKFTDLGLNYQNMEWLGEYPFI